MLMTATMIGEGRSPDGCHYFDLSLSAPMVFYELDSSAVFFQEEPAKIWTYRVRCIEVFTQEDAPPKKWRMYPQKLNPETELWEMAFPGDNYYRAYREYQSRDKGWAPELLAQLGYRWLAWVDFPSWIKDREELQPHLDYSGEGKYLGYAEDQPNPHSEN